MKDGLMEKLKQEKALYTVQEVTWLLNHLGDPNPEIRDQLVFNTLARGISENLLTAAQFRYLTEQTITNDLQFFCLNQGLPITAHRTFAALLNANLIAADGDLESDYYHLLNDEQRQYLFESAVTYLEKEHDFTGFDSHYGWIHAVAHGGDFLDAAFQHEKFPLMLQAEALKSIGQIFTRLRQPLIDGEARRLAAVIYHGLLNGKMTQTQVAEWIETFDFPLEENIDFYRLAAFEDFLAAIWFHTQEILELEPQFKESLLRYLRVL